MGKLARTGQASAAVAIAYEVAERTTNPSRVTTAIRASTRQTGYPGRGGWEPHTVARGDAGLAVMCACFDACFPGEGWSQTAHGLLANAARAAERAQRLTAGVLDGVAGLALATWLLSRGETRYSRLLKTLEAALLPRAAALTERARAGGGRVASPVVDVVSGLSGVGGYLLLRRDHPPARMALKAVLGALVKISGTDDGVIRARTPERGSPPAGSVDCGLAHGVPGPALLALSLRDGVEVPGQREAVNLTADWLARQRVDDEWGPNWPASVPVSASADDARAQPSRAAWCYGSPGVARALWLAGEAAGRNDLCDLAVESLQAVHRRPWVRLGIDSPTFCHGVAGLLQITMRFAYDTELHIFRSAAADLVGQVLAAYEPDSLLAYRDLEPDGKPVDEPGLLDGAAGVAAVLLTAGTDYEPSWDRLFLLS